ncbi:uncharacterized protein SCHCODRAFT_01258907 [Schizophyllum commune H4-8]|uniref:uncharacterized protein n=1 Tax=Schizophyllum commune (strain H4-8 / FGSC 9210) TaxID=578458 RepID=UPI00215FC7CF|nr:uncharacterized protein SCHCODRAFT_01258907 [Schizophyllum commune H4-8]KAI5885217.1 hypothetical protein SCHCODRAFT_01258907 [Schizophyllum commune H4-8]
MKTPQSRAGCAVPQLLFRPAHGVCLRSLHISSVPSLHAPLSSSQNTSAFLAQLHLASPRLGTTSLTSPSKYSPLPPLSSPAHRPHAHGALSRPYDPRTTCPVKRDGFRIRDAVRAVS